MDRKRPRRCAFLLPGLCLPLLLLAAACSGGGVGTLDGASLRAGDVPGGWTPADFPQDEGQALWDTLPELLARDSQVRLLLKAYESESGAQGAATLLVEPDDPAAVPKSSTSDAFLQRITRLLAQQDALLAPEARGTDPGTYVAASDEPIDGALRSRLVHLIEDGQYLFFDSMTFNVGPVFAVVSVWYPQEVGPERSLDDLASAVRERLLVYVGEG